MSDIAHNRVKNGPERALRVEGKTYRGRDKNPTVRDEVDDPAYQWLREQYREEHGTMDGWEQYARDNGFITVKSLRRDWKHTETLDVDVIDRKTGAHCPACERKQSTSDNTVE